VKGLVPVAMISIGRGRPTEHPPSTSRGSPMSDDVTSQKDPLRWIFHRFRLRMRTQFCLNTFMFTRGETLYFDYLIIVVL
jgi:hypothetical protein